MPTVTPGAAAPIPHSNPVPRNEAVTSGVSWGAILGGAFVATAMGLILLSLGSALGFAAASPWADSGASSRAIGIGAIVWLVIVQIISAGMGGYVAGRLRTKWATVHTDEVAFRDTAHGFIVWAVGVVVTVSVLGSAVTSTIGTGAEMAGNVASGAMRAAAGAAGDVAGPNSGAYFTDMLLRSDKAATDANDGSTRTELGRIMVRGMADGQLIPPARPRRHWRLQASCPC